MIKQKVKEIIKQRFMTATYVSLGLVLILKITLIIFQFNCHNQIAESQLLTTSI